VFAGKNKYSVQEQFIRILKLLPSFLLAVGLYAQAPVITSIQESGE